LCLLLDAPALAGTPELGFQLFSQIVRHGTRMEPDSPVGVIDPHGDDCYALDYAKHAGLVQNDGTTRPRVGNPRMTRRRHSPDPSFLP
jgi:hypothetical protein